MTKFYHLHNSWASYSARKNAATPILTHLGASARISPEQAADDDQDQQEQADARHGPEGNLQRRLRLPPELRGGRVGGGDVPDDGGQVLHPEGALPLAVVPEGRGVLRGVDGEELLYLPRHGHVPVHAQDVLGGGIPVPR